MTFGSGVEKEYRPAPPERVDPIFVAQVPSEKHTRAKNGQDLSQGGSRDCIVQQ